MAIKSSIKRSHASSFFSGVFLLSASTLIVKVIGLAYKIPMLSYLGAEGMGYFNSAYEIYAFLCVISTAGLPVALSILISSYREKGKIGSINKIYKSALSIFAFLGFIGTVILLIFAEELSASIENPNAIHCIRAIAPALLFVCLSSAVRGYFQGYGNMLPTAVSQLIEAVGKLLFGILFAVIAIKKSYTLDVVSAFAVLGLSLGTLVSAVYLGITKIEKSRKDKHLLSDLSQDKLKGAWKMLLRIALPITLSSAVISVTRIIDMTLIMRRLQDIGYTSGTANEIYGAYSTTAIPIFSLIPSLLTPVSLALVPALSSAIERRSASAQSEVVENSLRLTSLFAIPASLAIIIYSEPIIQMLFSGADTQVKNVFSLLSILGASVPFACIITTTNAILQACRKTVVPIISMAVGALIKIVLAYILIGIPSVNVYGAPISTFACDMVISVINLSVIYKNISARSGMLKIYLKPLVASILSMIISLGAYMPISFKTHSTALGFFVAAPIALIAYFSISFLIKSITAEDIRMIPAGDKIEKILCVRTLKGRQNKKEN